MLFAPKSLNLIRFTILFLIIGLSVQAQNAHRKSEISNSKIENFATDRNIFRNPVEIYYNKSQWGEGGGIAIPFVGFPLGKYDNTKKTFNGAFFSINAEAFATNYNFDPKISVRVPNPKYTDPLSIRFLSGEIGQVNIGAKFNFSFFNWIHVFFRFACGPTLHHYIENVYLLEFIAIQNNSSPVLKYNLYYYNQNKESVFGTSGETGAYFKLHKNLGGLVSVRFLQLPQRMSQNWLAMYKLGFSFGFR